MILLALDTSLGPCSVALYRDGNVSRETIETASGQQSRLLIGMIETLLQQESLEYKDLSAIACVVGPGGFTGIRTGLATARAIALACNIPLIGLSSLEVMAFAAQHPEECLVIIDAYRGQWYAQHFSAAPSLTALGEPHLIDQAAKAASTLALVSPTLHAADVARLAATHWVSGKRQFLTNPLYIREPDAKLPSQLPPVISRTTS